MKLKWLQIGFGLCTILLLAGCSQRGASEVTLYPYGSWVMTEVVQDGARQVLRGKVFTLVLAEEGQANGQVACNRWHGSGTATATTLQLEKTGSTRKRCHFDESWMSTLEMRYLRLLGEGAAYTATANSLTLTFSNDDQWTFVRE